MFLPTTLEEARSLGWEGLDIVLVTGDAYIDAPHIGVAVVGNVLADAGFRVGVIAQPDITDDRDIRRLGEPDLFWGVTAGCMDSMVANYTSLNKRRRSDDLTPGGRNVKRPDRATIVYANLIRRCFKSTRPIVIGGIEASLRRISHYDHWSDSVRRAVMVDARADILVYGMADRTVVQLARRLAENRPVTDLRGICYLAAAPPDGYLLLPPHETVVRDPKQYVEMFRLFYENSDPFSARGLAQRQDTRYLVHNPPQPPPSTEELDRVYGLDFERAAHPSHGRAGEVRCLDTIGSALITHQGCFGGCRFCAIAVHQGRRVACRSEASIVAEARRLVRRPGFKGSIADVGGPTANMYGMVCRRPEARGICRRQSCLFPSVCRHLNLSHESQIALLRRIRHLEGIKKVFIGSGVRHDLILADRAFGDAYLEEIVQHHVSGQLKIAPEHTVDHVLHLMGKPGPRALIDFKARFDRLCRSHGRSQYLTYYFIAAHPGCTRGDMISLGRFVDRELHFRPRQVQIFTPTPGTWSTTMYFTGLDPDSGEAVFVEKSLREKNRQKEILIALRPVGSASKRRVRRKPIE